MRAALQGHMRRAMTGALRALAGSGRPRNHARASEIQRISAYPVAPPGDVCEALAPRLTLRDRRPNGRRRPQVHDSERTAIGWDVLVARGSSASSGAGDATSAHARGSGSGF